MQAGEKRWAGTTYGNGWMHRSLTVFLRVVDVRVAYAFVAVFVVPVCLLLPSARPVHRYLRERCGMGRMRALGALYRNHFLFAQVVIDRFAMYAGVRFDLQLEGYDNFLRLASADDGFVMMSAHVGNYELAGYTLVSDRKPMNALVFGGEKESVMEARTMMFGTSRISMIPIRSDMSHLFDINRALSEGEIVSLPADRLFGSPKSIPIRFMGAVAQFPVGPFVTATLRGLDVLAVNVMKTGTKRYTAYITPLDYDRTLPRRQQTEALAHAYAAELERVLRRYPTQWYNYYDFWTTA